MAVARYGKIAAFGIWPFGLPLNGFPQGKSRVVMRANDFVKVFIRPAIGEVREFRVELKNNQWVPLAEIANHKRSNV